MWFDDDQFHFVWELSGDFILRTRAQLLGEGVDAHRKLGWMIRSTLDPNSPYIDVAVHGDGLTSMQYRRAKGAETEEVSSQLKAPDIIQLMRKANDTRCRLPGDGDPLESEELDEIDLGDEVYVGLFVCAHNPDVIERRPFSECSCDHTGSRVISPLPGLHW